ncbi:23S rRNA (uracil(1939)-C(5))-methyltransferase RlmD [Vibrio sp. Of7-15]|uniref:23S rRNA (uracil(1939)-C(5))-methyltransferase RlmD n=1 Tax=Vibrio sp. Of7-15 TaxID=2724879 RepID=UPI001EF39EDD|nr:23S rRNA (uracil(1939)-C(5))-methyltransferase RlmD [Vibrio sp. Of7-15]MCG7499074.1 23S rRNA (uracil(1939)-C(5))-methyltransferase RlmD [Vibrio sp. Of7-15]
MARFFKPQKRTTVDKKHKAIMIERLDHAGAGIGFLDKKLIFVDGVLPGEKAVVQLTEQKKSYAKAKLIKLQSQSNERIEPFCQHYRQCGGCNLQHLSHEGQVAAKEASLAELMNKFAGADLKQAEAIVAGDKGYRRRARFSLMFDKNTKQLKMGFRKKQSKEIVDVRHCPVLVPSLDELLNELYALLSQLKAYKDLGHVELVEAENGRVCLLRHLKPLKEQDKTALLNFAQQHDLILYLASSPEHCERVVGDEPYYSMNGAKLNFSPQNFIQVNKTVNEKMVAQALQWLDVQKDDRVLDLFCGLGNFSLPLAQKASAVVGVEGVDEMVERATENAKQNQLSNAEFYQADLEQDITNQVWAKAKFSKILLDPARAGAAGVMEYVAELNAQSVVYVSCNPATLARDSQVLLQRGYKLHKLGMLDMFPHTGHLESMALFVKQAAK